MTERGAKENITKEQAAVEQTKFASETLFSLSGQKEEAVQWSSGAASAPAPVIARACMQRVDLIDDRHLMF